MHINNGIIIILFFVLSSCGFNKMFYQAEKLQSPPISWQINNAYNRDTLVIHIKDSSFQPSFTDARNNPRELSYTVESVVITSKNGNKLNAWFYKPKAVSFNGITLFFLHGNGGNLLSHMGGTVPLVKQGFQVFVVDYSGYGFSTGKPTRKNVLTDANSALAYLLNRPDVKNTRVVIYGQSLGGHLSATVAKQNEKGIDGLVMEGAFSSHKDIAAHFAGKWGFLARILVKEKYTAVKSVQHFHKPLLVIQSSEDEIVPEWMGKKIYNHANMPKSYYEIKHSHICGPIYYPDSIADKIKTMIGK